MKRLARFAVIALSICLMTMAASRHFVSPVNANERRSDQKTPARRALLIGIGKYDSLKFPTLEYPVNDVARMSELLRSPLRENVNPPVAEVSYASVASTETSGIASSISIVAAYTSSRV